MEGKKNRFELSENIQYIFLYIFLLLGGLWHYLDVFQSVMNTIAGGILIVLSIINVVKFYNKNEDTLDTGKYFIFVIVVIFGGFILEYYGVKTGVIFGNYIYGDNLIPQIDGVPVAIGFAWIMVLITSKSLLGVFFKKFYKLNVFIQSIFIALYMTVFDVFMEPAAIELGYWSWFDGIPTLRNYIAWFVFGYIFALIGFALKVLDKKDSKFSVHTFYAQLLYFLMITLL